MDWKIEFSRSVVKDAKKLKVANHESNLKSLLEIIKQNPYEPLYEKLSGNLKGYLSSRINIKHRCVYSVNEQTKTIRVVSVWSHYEYVPQRNKKLKPKHVKLPQRARFTCLGFNFSFAYSLPTKEIGI
ncbi:Txe/YoeB family addiction module toxin [Pseudanabaena sp. lw0831]|uniref:Txe/YoeB family addiction module toxin n=1 Tax=Pseudanabaena sp. lw0831 TaxID=1357935 RepID=UPI001916955C|nr:Txe/YoeB family addiction module toxin [Pseudanabaena sp. lw0831]